MTDNIRITGTHEQHYSHPAIMGLLEALQDRDWQRRARAAEALGELGDPVAVPHLLWALYGDRDEWARASIIKSLGQIGDPSAIMALVETLSDTDWWFDRRICDVAADALRQIGTPESLAVVEMWEHEQREVEHDGPPTSENALPLV